MSTVPHYRLVRSLLLVVTAACGSVDGPSQSFDEHLKAWREIAPASYEFEYAQQCFCSQAGVWYRVQVTNGTFVSVTPVNVVLPPGLNPRHFTMDSIFAQAKAAIRDKNASVGITYDPIWHNPSAIRVDPIKNAIDDEWELLVRAVKAAP